jgi:hypothetical protein
MPANRTDVRRPDPGDRRQAVLIVLAGACLGAFLILLLERYRVPLRDWVLANPGTSANRARLVIVLLAGALFAPLFALAGYLWWHGGKALSRAPLLQMLGVGCCIACAALALLLWRLLSVLSF